MARMKVTRCAQCRREQADIEDDPHENEEQLRQIGWRKLADGAWRCPFCKPD